MSQEICGYFDFFGQNVACVLRVSTPGGQEVGSVLRTLSADFVTEPYNIYIYPTISSQTRSRSLRSAFEMGQPWIFHGSKSVSLHDHLATSRFLLRFAVAVIPEPVLSSSVSSI